LIGTLPDNYLLGKKESGLTGYRPELQRQHMTEVGFGKKNRNKSFIFSFRAARKGCEMRERTAVKVARFVPRRGGKSNPSFLFN
jgi:hypothetical protein